jgi:hypothetical protein
VYENNRFYRFFQNKWHEQRQKDMSQEIIALIISTHLPSIRNHARPEVLLMNGQENPPNSKWKHTDTKIYKVSVVGKGYGEKTRPVRKDWEFQSSREEISDNKTFTDISEVTWGTNLHSFWRNHIPEEWHCPRIWNEMGKEQIYLGDRRTWLNYQW